MKQIIQSFRTGELTVADVPTPQLRPRGILVRNAASLVSAGTERMVIDFAEKSLIQKARARPDLVRQVLDKARREGVLNTIASVRNRLDQALPLGYSSAGVVVAVGAETKTFAVGDRVACAGAGYATHAEMVYIPRNMAVKLPDQVSFEAGAFATLGAIALQGVRLAEVVLGHNALVIGLGLIGQLTVQLLKAAGCRVMGIDLNPQRVELAQHMGADEACLNDEAHGRARAFTGERGFDAVLITADTRSSGPVTLAGELARDRAIVVAVGAVGMNIPRKVYYEKELAFRVSRSYGPGRYDRDYEDKGQDYPYAYVRFTQQRNMETFVQLADAGSVKIDPLISHRYTIDRAVEAYNVITGKAGVSFLGVVLQYDTARALPDRIALHTNGAHAPAEVGIRLGLAGAGNFTMNALLPAMKDVPGLELRGVVSGSGLSARQAGDRFGFQYCADSLDALLKDGAINWVAITTQHDLHASQAQAVMQAGKHVFVEKPLALDRANLLEVMRTQRATGQRLMVGFNRRFAPLVVEMRKFLARHNRPLVAICRVNAGFIPPGHWTQDTTTGGGRIIGEACHFIDLLQYLVGSLPVEVYARAIQTAQGPVEDEAVITLTYEDGSVGTVIYAAGGDKAYGKERIEIIGDGRVAVIDDYHTLETIHDGKREQKKARMRTSKGHREEWETLVAAARAGSPTPISPEEIAASHLATFAAVDSLRERLPIKLDLPAFWAEVAGVAVQ